MTWGKNVIVGASTSNYVPEWQGGWITAAIAYPSTWTGVMVNQAAPGTNFAGYKVVAGSVYDNGGTDGKDIGCDIDAMNAATAGCITGTWSAPPVTVTLKKSGSNVV